MLGWRKTTRPGLLVLLLGLSGCSGKEFTSDGAAGSAGSGGSGGSDAAGSSSGGSGGSNSAGDTSSAGTPDTGGSGGSGGATPGGCDCPAGYYCRDGTVDCFDCMELNRLHFSTPERMTTLSDNGQGSHFPRIGSTATDLLYRGEGAGLRYTADASTSAGSNVKGTQETDSGPLLLSRELAANGAVTLMGFNFLFDRELDGRRSLYIGQWGQGLAMAERAPAPFNADGNDYSVAVALNPTGDSVARAFWMSDRDAMSPLLVTATQEAAAAVLPVALSIGQETCPASDADLAPWVTNDGKLLVVSHPHLNASCDATTEGNKDIYTALLQPATGQPTAAALPMNDVNSPKNDVEPSFSADMCELYFASDREGKFALYRAHRR